MPAMSEETKAALATLPEAAQKELQGLLEKFGPRAYEPAAEPVEYETGGEIDTAVLVLHGIGGSGAKMEEGKFREGVQLDGFNSKKFFEAGGVKGARIVLPTASKTTAPRLLEFLKAGGVGDGVEPQISWVESFKDFEDPTQGFDWAVPSYDSLAVEYVQSLIRKEISRGIAPNRVFVLCHSQGGSVGSRAVLTFDDAPLGGLIMLSAWHASPDIAALTSEKQKSLPILCAHSPSDGIVAFPGVRDMCECFVEAVGKANFNGGGPIIEEDDNPAFVKYHAPFVPSMAKPVGDLIMKKEAAAPAAES